MESEPVPTMKEVALHAGVALSSVSRVLNDHADVSDAMRARVMDAIEELGYEPNLIASSLRRGSTRTVGFVVSDIANPLFADLAKGAERTLDESGYATVLTNSEGDASRDESMIRLLRWRRVDGLLLSVADERRPGTLAELAKFEAPIVLLDRVISTLEDSASSVVTDHAAGMKEATGHLLDLGHRRIALISGSPKIRASNDRLSGFKRAYRAHKVPYPKDLLRLGTFDPSYGEEMVTELLGQDDPPTAIICGGNLLLVGVLRALRTARKKVGRDISLISCDDIPLAEFHTPPITVIERDTLRMGEVAAELLLERLMGPDLGPRTVVVETSLKLRKSTRPART